MLRNDRGKSGNRQEVNFVVSLLVAVLGAGLAELLRTFVPQVGNAIKDQPWVSTLVFSISVGMTVWAVLSLRNAKRLVAECDPNAFRQMSESVTSYDLSELEARGVFAIYADRERARTAMAELVEAQGAGADITILGVTLYSELIKPRDESGRRLREALLKAVDPGKADLTTYAIDPTSQQGLVRAWHEGPRHGTWGTTRLLTDASLTIEELAKTESGWGQLIGRGRLVPRYYSEPPPHGWVLAVTREDGEHNTVGWAFYEPYHLGRADVRNAATHEGEFCEKMPVLKLEMGRATGRVDLYKAIMDHVGRISELASPRADHGAVTPGAVRNELGRIAERTKAVGKEPLPTEPEGLRKHGLINPGGEGGETTQCPGT